jgi:hypothetical protein
MFINSVFLVMAGVALFGVYKVTEKYSMTFWPSLAYLVLSAIAMVLAAIVGSNLENIF